MTILMGIIFFAKSLILGNRVRKSAITSHQLCDSEALQLINSSTYKLINYHLLRQRKP